jgi:nucleoside-diphosphate-sugar epimerase
MTRFRGAIVFVTGGGGFIGSAVVRHSLRDTEARVVNVDKLTYAANLDSLPGAAGKRVPPSGDNAFAMDRRCAASWRRIGPTR